jgi:hypothetical protein
MLSCFIQIDGIADRCGMFKIAFAIIITSYSKRFLVCPRGGVLSAVLLSLKLISAVVIAS